MTDQPWTDADNERRCELIDVAISGPISTDNLIELDVLTERFRQHKAEVAPLPIEEARATLKRINEEKEREACEAYVREHLPEWLDFEQAVGFDNLTKPCAFRQGWLARAALDRGDLPPMMKLPEGETSCDT